MTVAALNWGTVGLFDLNLVNLIFGSMPTLEKVIYSLVGISGIHGTLMMFGIGVVKN